MDSSVQRRTFSTTVAAIAEMDSWIEEVGRLWHQTERTVFSARLCVAELAANVIEHGVSRDADDQIVVTLRHQSDGMTIEFVDSRTAFDPTRPVVAPVDDRLETISISGRGLALLQAFARDMTYHRDGQHNRVSLTIRPAEDAR